MTSKDARRIFRELFKLSATYRSASDFETVGLVRFEALLYGTDKDFTRPIRALFYGLVTDKRLTEQGSSGSDVASNNARVDSYYWQVQDYIDALESKEQQQEEESRR